MPYALFTALPFVGHLNPLIRQAEELQRRGWRVAVAAAPEMRPHIERESPGLPFVDIGALGEILVELRSAEARASADPDFRRGGTHFLPALGRIWPVMFDGLVRAIGADRPDLLVADIFSWAGIDAAGATGVKMAANNPSLLTGVPLRLMPPAPGVPFMTTGQSIHDIGWMQRAAEPLIRHLLIAGVWFTVERGLTALRRSRGLEPIAMHEQVRQATILVNGAFGLEYRRALPPNVHMVGPMLNEVPPLTPEINAWLSDGPPVIYVNLGTVAVASAPLVARILEGVTIPGTRVLWILKPAQAALLPQPVPSTVRILDWVSSPRAVLAHPNVRVFLSHCGINSVHESLAAGTPIVGIPMMADQRDMAARVADAGVGLWLDKSRFRAGDLRAAIERVLHEPSFRGAVPALQKAFADAGGLKTAGDLLERAAAGRPQ